LHRSDNHLEGEIIHMNIHVITYDKKGGYHVNYYVGLDLHSRNTYLGIIDEKGDRVYKSKMSNFLELVLNALNPFSESIEGIAVESTFN